MKRTIIMLAVIATFLLTWLSVGCIGYYLSSDTLKVCLTDVGTVMLMFVVGWIPAVIVGIDLSERD